MPMVDIPKRELGRTGLHVTMLGYGAMELHGAPRGRDVTEAQAETILNTALDAGINYLDTSIDYGLREERIGRYVAHRRSEYYLASKCGCVVGADPAPRDQRNRHVYTRDNIRAGVEQSLKRMQTEYLDVVQFHGSPSKQVLEEHGALDAVQELQQAGKVRFIGMSSTLPHLQDHIAMGVFDVFQIPYSALQREHENVISAAAAGSRHRHSRRRGQGRPIGGKAGRESMGPMAAGSPRRSPRRHDAHGVHPALYVQPSGDAHEHRRHHQPGTPAGQHPHLAPRPAAAADLCRGQAAPGGRRLSHSVGRVVLNERGRGATLQWSLMALTMRCRCDAYALTLDAKRSAPSAQTLHPASHSHPAAPPATHASPVAAVHPRRCRAQCTSAASGWSAPSASPSRP